MGTSRRPLRRRLPRPVRRAIGSVAPADARPAFPWEAKRAADDYGRSAEPDWREIDWQRHLHRAKVAGREITYVDIGEGDDPPVIFIHGLGGNWQNWLENIPRVARERRVIAMDLPGFGTSEMPADKITVTGYAHWLDDLLDTVGIENVVVVGNSMGGFIAAEMAITLPHRVERLVLAAAAGISITNLRRRPVMTLQRAASSFALYGAANSHAVVARPRLRHAFLSWVFRHPSRIPPDLILEVMQGIGKPGFKPALDALLSYDFRDRLPEIECPVLVIWGAEDMIVPARDAHRFEEAIPHSRVVVFDEVGHVPMMERPIAFNDCLMEFLADSRAPSSAEAAAGNGKPAPEPARD